MPRNDSPLSQMMMLATRTVPITRMGESTLGKDVPQQDHPVAGATLRAASTNSFSLMLSTLPRMVRA